MHRSPGCLASVAILLGAAALRLEAADLAGMRVIYLTDEAYPERTRAFSHWLGPQVRAFTTVTYSTTKTPTVEELSNADAVLLDWDQKTLHYDKGSWSDAAAHFPNPLGGRGAWRTPTVLLGSAGLMVASTWAVAGDRGCTCLAPLAYDLRDHPVARGPLPIDRSLTITIPTPADFTGDIHAPTIDVLPLAQGDPAAAQRAAPGWCVYLDALRTMPDVEWISGGVNLKTVTAAGIWRQGNLLHFGFAQNPEELNEQGRHLLANAIAYIADFHQDRPLARQILDVQGGSYVPSRSSIARWLGFRGPDGKPYDSVLKILAEDERRRMEGLILDPQRFTDWCSGRRPYLMPDHQMLMVDEDLLEARTAYDGPDFLQLVAAHLRSADSTRIQKAQRLVARYLPDCPSGVPPAEQAAWIDRLTPFLFAGDAVGYRWWIDDLAVARGIPSADLRGPARCDAAGAVCDPATGICTPH